MAFRAPAGGGPRAPLCLKRPGAGADNDDVRAATYGPHSRTVKGMGHMILARLRAFQHGCRTTTRVPWMARVRVRRRSPGRIVLRVTATLVLALALDAAAYAQQAPAPEPSGTAVVQDPPADVVAGSAPRPAAAEPPAVRTAPAPQPPTDLHSVSAWVSYRAAAHVAALPVESRLFYRRGLIVRQSGQLADALELVRGASELDPGYLEPHLTLASWLLMREPSQALLQYASALEIVRQNFNLQVELAANAFLFALRAIFAGLLAAGLLVVVLRQATLRHPWYESLAFRFSPGSARVWSWGLLILPFVVGFGLTLPTLFFLGVAWSDLRLRERALFVLLTLAVVCAPLSRGVLARMSLPIREDRGPFFGVPMLENEPYSPARRDQLAALAKRHPDDPFLQFGLAWTARRGGDLATSEAAYRRALAVWPDDDRLLNNLGNVLSMQGRGAEALKLYEKATQANPTNAAPYFNESQVYTQRFEYQAASNAVSRASALNFELVKNAQSQGTNDGLLPLVDQWLSPHTFWTALWSAPLGRGLDGTLPVSLRRHIEASGWIFSVLGLLAAGLGVAAGIWQGKRLPLRACSNCGRIVCRRCAERRREHAYCPDCAEIESRAETQDFSRMLLYQHRAKGRRAAHLVRTAFAAIVPGFGLLAHRRVFSAIVLLSATWSIGCAWIGSTSPFAVEPRLALAGDEVPVTLLAVGLGLVYLASLLGYANLVRQEAAREAALQASQRGRITQATRRSSPLAA